MSSRNDTRFYHVCGEVMLLQVGPRAFTACGTVALRVSRSASRTNGLRVTKAPAGPAVPPYLNQASSGSECPGPTAKIRRIRPAYLSSVPREGAYDVAFFSVLGAEAPVDTPLEPIGELEPNGEDPTSAGAGSAGRV